MNRDIQRLSDEKFDLLVVGGGIYGAWTAYDAALRGLRVALIEKSDWASGTSSTSSKLIHGGLRYLEQMHFGLVKNALEERKLLTRLGPHRVNPLRFLIPVYRGARAGRFRLRIGLWLYDRLAGSGQPVQGHESLDARDVTTRHPYLNPEGLTGGLTYGDCQTDDAQFVFEIVAGADGAGAAVANYVKATRFLVSGGRVGGVAAVDESTGEELDIRADAVVNTTGMWPPVPGTSAPAPKMRLSKGVHLIMPALPCKDALLVMSRRDNRVFFVIPWYGKTLLGTTDSDYDGDLDHVRVEDSDIDYLIGEAGRVIREPSWDPSMIEGKFAGVRALKFEPGKSPSSVTREWILESPVERLLVSIGGKLTSARADAASIVDRVCSLLGKKSRPCTTAEKSFPWSPDEPYPQWTESTAKEARRLGLDPECSAVAARRYGSHIEAVFDIVRENPALAQRLDPRLPFIGAELVIAARHGMVQTLTDLLRRRIPLLILAPVDEAAIESAARLAASELGWSEQRVRREIDEAIKQSR